MKPIDLNKRRASKLHEQGEKLSDEGRTSEAIEKYLEAIACDPSKSESYYNIGLLYKYQGEWEKSFDFNQKANELDPEDEAARWNLAIAATALRRWEVARKKWRENGLPIAGTGGPIEMDLGITPVRLNPDDAGEVVWATRIDPARAKIESIPFPESGFRYGDVVLNDGAAVGYRQVGGREVPVLNVLELFERSEFETYVAHVQAEDPSDLESLQRIFSGSHSSVEDWTVNTRTLCRQCSEGRPHEHHDHELEKEWSVEHRLGIAVHPTDDVRQLLEQWEAASQGKVLSIEVGYNPE
ncbi:MAG TPA: tetratricopeptide repeat protein [Gemmatimonadales bacterium]|nr:tetratricopeptide repeat protein [Gemmatimonadales bacterium]